MQVFWRPLQLGGGDSLANSRTQVGQQAGQVRRRVEGGPEGGGQPREAVVRRNALAASSSALQGALVLWVQLAPPTQA